MTGNTFVGKPSEQAPLTNVDQEMDVMHEKVFGASRDGHRLHRGSHPLCKRFPLRLSSYGYTDDYRLAMRFAEDLAFGEIYCNRSIGEHWQGHHVGWNESGIGGEGGKYGVSRYMQLKTVYHNDEGASECKVLDIIPKIDYTAF